MSFSGLDLGRRTMYAIISDGGRQFKVTEGQILDIDYREKLAAGEQLKFEKVLAMNDGKATKFGAPLIDGFSVAAEVIGLEQGPKLVVQKFRRRKNSRRRNGHRQLY